MSHADSLLERVADSPDDMALRERAARALVEADRAAEAVALLQQGFIHFNGHDPSALPCLCRRCIVPAETTAVVGGSTFLREFVIAPGVPRGWVLFFWIPEELARERRRVRRSVETGLRSRLGKHARSQYEEDEV